MPAKKTDSNRSSTNKKTTAGNSRAANNKQSPAPAKKAGGDTGRLLHLLMPFVLVIIAVFIFVCYVTSDSESTGFVGGILRNAMFGLFSGGAWLVPIALVFTGVFWRRDVSKGRIVSRCVFAFLFLMFVSVLLHAIARNDGAIVKTFNVVDLFEFGCSMVGGGIVGGLVGNLFLMMLGFIGTTILSIPLILLLGMFTVGVTPHKLASTVKAAIASWRESRDERAEAEREKKARQTPERDTANQPQKPKQAPAVHPERTKRKKGVIDSLEDRPEKNFYDAVEDDETLVQDLADDEDTADAAPSDAPVVVISDAPPFENAGAASVVENISPEPATGMQELSDAESDEIDLAKIFAEPDETGEIAIPGIPVDDNAVTTAEIDLTVEKGDLRYDAVASQPDVADDDDDDDEPPFEMDENTRFVSVGSGATQHEQVTIDYAFPPISLLKADRQTKNADISSEIQQTANKLVETLRSFNVKTKIINVSRGPTVTRYELQPEVGTKVRSIVNLVDDIALHLATSGVRIEAPIPGKEAVGIEVPNRTTSTVYIRELLEDEAFKANKSKVVTALGMDVAGAPVFLDVSKMPHLLIAGTTGSGKSVCINSLIVSMLYKARPDEVKFIMVDPKKVELNVYNGIPHLLVPVVSDPKKAAGSLHWAVTEMERRYELIEGAGVRNIKGYNDSIANDPDAEKLPQIVIIIDELADLMMMARDDVEEAICRIAQKARAAGMHLVLGTQRPTVDVVTGLIKANVPSRIAFTTFSQMDSRTIIDTVGAEKLIGRGDMLYAPIGSVKPTRVQGCFVSDEEVEEVTTFIKNNYGVREYDKEVMETIEREAQLCGNKKATVLGDGDEEANDGDPMLRPAIQLAVESGKISTSLIQRKLQLGYGRAAKLIDAMEQMGVVSPPQGQKPRDVLISKSEWMEMELRRED